MDDGERVYVVIGRSYTGHPEVKVVPKNGLYDIVASVSLQPNLEASTTFECILRIPETDYSVTRALPLTPESLRIAESSGVDLCLWRSYRQRPSERRMLTFEDVSNMGSETLKLHST
ncbi:hypothetical protein AAG570_001073 [Ranatra chinensis]|uniref:Uncharacterized protein n=1 Tax=Ranatra chinensis TaxID=642074 RepID=A0ABD0YPN8_9HEMI